MGLEDRAWDFRTREAFVAFALATFVEWTRHLPESDCPAFVTEVLDRYRTVTPGRPREANSFRFYQLEVVLERA
jgi:trans-aconitate 2-methyltransferase